MSGQHPQDALTQSFPLPPPVFGYLVPPSAGDKYRRAFENMVNNEFKKATDALPRLTAPLAAILVLAGLKKKIEMASV